MAQPAPSLSPEELRRKENIEKAPTQPPEEEGGLSDEPEELAEQLEAGAQAAESAVIEDPGKAYTAAAKHLGGGTAEVQQTTETYRERAGNLVSDFMTRVRTLLKRRERPTETAEPAAPSEVAVTAPEQPIEPTTTEPAITDAQQARADTAPPVVETVEVELKGPLATQVEKLRADGKFAAAVETAMKTALHEIPREDLPRHQAILLTELHRLSALAPGLHGAERDALAIDLDTVVDGYNKGVEEQDRDNKGNYKFDPKGNPVMVRMHRPPFSYNAIQAERERANKLFESASRRVFGQSIDEWKVSLKREKETGDTGGGVKQKDESDKYSPTDYQILRAIGTAIEKTSAAPRKFLGMLGKIVKTVMFDLPVNILKLILVLGSRELQGRSERKRVLTEGGAKEYAPTKLAEYLGSNRRLDDILTQIETIQDRLADLQRLNEQPATSQAEPFARREYEITPANEQVVIDRATLQLLFQRQIDSLLQTGNYKVVERMLSDPTAIENSFQHDKQAGTVSFTGDQSQGKFNKTEVADARRLASYGIKNEPALHQAAALIAAKAGSGNEALSRALRAGNFITTVEGDGSILLEVVVRSKKRPVSLEDEGADDSSQGSIRRVRIDKTTSAKIFRAIDGGLVETQGNNNGRFSEENLRIILGDELAEPPVNKELQQDLRPVGALEQTMVDFHAKVLQLEQQFASGKDQVANGRELTTLYRQVGNELLVLQEDFPTNSEFGSAVNSLAKNMADTAATYDRLVKIVVTEAESQPPATTSIEEKNRVVQQLIKLGVERITSLQSFRLSLERSQRLPIENMFKNLSALPERNKIVSKYSVDTILTLPNERFLGTAGEGTWKIVKAEHGLNVLQLQPEDDELAATYFHLLMTDAEIDGWMKAAKIRNKRERSQKTILPNEAATILREEQPPARPAATARLAA